MANDGPQQEAAAPVKPTSQWGIYSSLGELVFAVDTFIGLEDAEKSKVSDFPVETGAFASYNKVQQPYQLKVRMAVGGDTARMAAFIAALYAAKESTELYVVATPEFTFQDATVENFSYKREPTKGANMVVAEVELKEVRQVVASYANVVLPPSKVKNKTAGDKKNNGKQNPAKPSDWKKTEGMSAREAKAAADIELKRLRAGGQ